jgi:hypothetical protein
MRTCLIGAAIALLGSTAYGSVLSGNFCSTARILDYPAGLLPVANWNDLTSPAGYLANDSKSNPIYADGSVAAGTVITWAVSDGGSQNTNDEVYRPMPPDSIGLHIDDGHDQMMAGYLQASKNSSTAPWLTLKVTGLDLAAFGGSYSVILYFDGDDDVASLTSAAALSIYSSQAAFEASQASLATYYGRDKDDVNYAVINDGSDPFSVYQQIVSTDPLNPTEGNYVQFDGLTGSELFVRFEGVPWEHGVALNGFQIIPEPATLAVLGLGSLALVLRRRR